MAECEGCAERREKIKAHLKAIAEWLKNPGTAPNPLSSKMPLPPQVRGRENNAKKEISH
jgi:hypothetical protein